MDFFWKHQHLLMEQRVLWNTNQLIKHIEKVHFNWLDTFKYIIRKSLQIYLVCCFIFGSIRFYSPKEKVQQRIPLQRRQTFTQERPWKNNNSSNPQAQTNIQPHLNYKAAPPAIHSHFKAKQNQNKINNKYNVNAWVTHDENTKRGVNDNVTARLVKKTQVLVVFWCFF